MTSLCAELARVFLDSACELSCSEVSITWTDACDFSAADLREKSVFDLLESVFVLMSTHVEPFAEPVSVFITRSWALVDITVTDFLLFSFKCKGYGGMDSFFVLSFLETGNSINEQNN